MTNELASWNLRIDEMANQCQALTVQLLMGLRSKVLAHRHTISSVLDALSLLDLLSGYVAYMNAKTGFTNFARPIICPYAGVQLLHKPVKLNIVGALF